MIDRDRYISKKTEGGGYYSLRNSRKLEIDKRHAPREIFLIGIMLECTKTKVRDYAIHLM